MTVGRGKGPDYSGFVGAGTGPVGGRRRWQVEAVGRQKRGRIAGRGGMDGKRQKRYAVALAPVAQMDRVLPSEGRSRTFESCRAHQTHVKEGT